MEWCRRKTWSDQDRTEFLARLERSRGQFHKAQYARCQAVELITAPTAENINGAIELLTLVINKYPEPGELASTYNSLADCHEFFGRYEDAIACYRESIRCQRAMPGHQTHAYLKFARLVADTRRSTDYQEALQLLVEFGDMGIFPVDEFLTCAVRALIHSDLGDLAAGKRWATRALTAAERNHSGFARHPQLGLVSPHESRLTKMRELAALP